MSFLIPIGLSISHDNHSTGMTTAPPQRGAGAAPLRKKSDGGPSTPAKYMEGSTLAHQTMRAAPLTGGT